MENKKLHYILLEMADYISEFAIKHNLKIYLCGGGCIGAIRHKGFIPWDDDLDFLMPRDDYEKFVELWNEYNSNYKYVLVKQDKNTITRTIFTNVVDITTTYIHDFQKDLDIPHGVAIDIFPLDAQPNTKIKRLIQKYNALKFTLFGSGHVPQNSGKFAKLISKMLLSIFKSDKKRYKIWKKAEENMTKYKMEDCNCVTQLCEGPYNIFHRSFDKSIFEDYIMVDFENRKLPIPKGYDLFLTITFGDYMKLPPVEKQVPHHDARFIDLDHPYTLYKNKEYLLKES